MCVVFGVSVVDFKVIGELFVVGFVVGGYIGVELIIEGVVLLFEECSEFCFKWFCVF